MVSKGMAAYVQFPGFSFYCAFEYENFIFSCFSLDLCSEGNKLDGNEEGFKCSEFENLPRLGPCQLLEPVVFLARRMEVSLHFVLFLLNPLEGATSCPPIAPLLQK